VVKILLSKDEKRQMCHARERSRMRNGKNATHALCSRMHNEKHAMHSERSRMHNEKHAMHSERSRMRNRRNAMKKRFSWHICGVCMGLSGRETAGFLPRSVDKAIQRVP
jgi:hypothetical protein